MKEIHATIDPSYVIIPPEKEALITMALGTNNVEKRDIAVLGMAALAATKREATAAVKHSDE